MKKTYNIVGHKKLFFTISLSIIALALIVSLFGVKIAIEFKGGTMITYGFKGDNVSISEVTKIAEDTLKTDVSVKEGTNISDKSKYYELSLNKKNGLSVDDQKKLTEALSAKFPDNEIERLNSNDVNPTVGKEFFQKCLVAVAFSFVVLVIYIGIRFRKIGGWSAGIMGIVALLHDVLIVYATFVIFRIPINANFMAVVLTILGYSINDTIVIYDRIRENETLLPKDTSFDHLVNLSVSQSLSRSINTSVSTALAMLVVTIVAFVTGVTSITSFAFPLIIGLISGTYSTICIATPLWVMWQNHKRKSNHNSYAKKKKK